MRYTLSKVLLCSAVSVLLGVGCTKPAKYIEAPAATPIQVPPNPEGAGASTGGVDATVTPVLKTELLVKALPNALSGMTAGDTIEQKNPIPLPDGTRTEYTTVTRSYQRIDDGVTKTIKLSLTDTRGIPALTIFLESYGERSGDDGYRAPATIQDARGWISYTYGLDGKENGTGSLTLLYRERFLIQIDGSNGVSVETLNSLADAFEFDYLK